MVDVGAVLDNGPEDAKGWMPALWEVHLHLCHSLNVKPYDPMYAGYSFEAFRAL